MSDAFVNPTARAAHCTGTAAASCRPWARSAALASVLSWTGACLSGADNPIATGSVPASAPRAPVELAEISAAPEPDFAVGTARADVDVSPRRRLPLQIWYPAVESARAEANAGRPIEEFET